jgi:DNA modification methylase
MKPVALIVAQLRNSLAPGGTVYDPCAGSGSTFIAADTLSSTAVVTDLDPRYVDVILKRYETLTGTFPVKHSNLLELAG